MGVCAQSVTLCLLRVLNLFPSLLFQIFFCGFLGPFAQMNGHAPGIHTALMETGKLLGVSPVLRPLLIAALSSLCAFQCVCWGAGVYNLLPAGSQRESSVELLPLQCRELPGEEDTLGLLGAARELDIVASKSQRDTHHPPAFSQAVICL